MSNGPTPPETPSRPGVFWVGLFALVALVVTLLAWVASAPPDRKARREAPAPERDVPVRGMSANRVSGAPPATPVAVSVPAATAVSLGASDSPEADGVIPDEVVWRFLSGAERDAFVRMAREAPDVEILDDRGFGHAVRLRYRQAAALQRLRSTEPRPRSEERNYVVKLPDPTPLDQRPAEAGYRPFLDKALSWLGVETPAADAGWGITVAVLDTAVERHPALNEGRVLRVGSAAGKADGGLAHHGTAVASLIGGNGERGITGPAPGARLISIPVMSGDGTGNSFALAQAIAQAVTLNADIINLSLGSSGDSPLLREAIAHALANGAVVVASVGNEGVDAVSYPARYPGVLAVGGVEADSRHTYFSNRGPAVDLVAPAYGINAAGTEAQTIHFSGTSAAAPLVSGALAALMAANRRLSGAEAMAILIATADDAGPPGRDPEFGAGVLNLGRALEYRTPGLIDMVAVPPVIVREAGGDTVLYLYAQNRGTEAVSEAILQVDVDGERRERRVKDVAVGATVAEEFVVDMQGQTVPRQVTLRYRIDVVQGTDRTPENNARGAVLTVQPAVAP